MSQEMLSQRVKKTCDVCGVSKEYELVAITPEVAKDLAEWYTVVREIFDGERFHKLMMQAYGIECLAASGVKMQLPPQPEESSIDLASLRQSNFLQ